LVQVGEECFFFLDRRAEAGERRQERTAAAENVPYAAVVVILPHFIILFKKNYRKHIK
jgi:hypothetical protein